MLHGRQLHINLPSPRPAAQSDDTIEAQSCRQQSYAQATPLKQLSPLQEEQNVTMYNHNPHSWKPATVIYVVPAPMSYQLPTTVGVVYRRNRRDIRVTPSTTANRVTPPHNPNCVIPNPSVSSTLPGCNSRGTNVTQPQNGSTYDGWTICYPLWTCIETNLHISVETLSVNIKINNIITAIYMYTLIMNINLF